MAFGTMGVILVDLGAAVASASPRRRCPTALLALPAGILVAIALCLLTDRWVYRFYRRAAQRRRSIFVIASVGVMFIYNALIRFVIGTDEQRFEDGARFVHARHRLQGNGPASTRASPIRDIAGASPSSSC